MTEDGEAPDAGADRDEEERTPATDLDESATPGEESTPAVDDDVDAGESVDAEELDSGDESGATTDGSAVEGQAAPSSAGPGGDAGSDVDDLGADQEVDHGDEGVDAVGGSARDEEHSEASPWGDADEDAAADDGTLADEGATADDDASLDEDPTGDGAGGGETRPGPESPAEAEASAGGDGAGATRSQPSDERVAERGDREPETRYGEETPGVEGEYQGTDEPGGGAAPAATGGDDASATVGGDDASATAGGSAGSHDVEAAGQPGTGAEPHVPEDVRSYDRFQKVDRASYDRVNEFLRDRTYVTAREWAIARLCADFRTATGVEMTKIGENLPHLVPFMTDTYSPQAVNQARSAFEEKVRKSGATFLYGAMSGFFTADELDDIMYEVTEVAKFLLEVEGVELTVDEELDAEDRISAVMREVRQASEELRYDEVSCPHCGEAFQPAEE